VDYLAEIDHENVDKDDIWFENHSLVIEFTRTEEGLTDRIPSGMVQIHGCSVSTNRDQHPMYAPLYRHLGPGRGILTITFQPLTAEEIKELEK
jgi:hypothetical protein